MYSIQVGQATTSFHPRTAATLGDSWTGLNRGINVSKNLDAWGNRVNFPFFHRSFPRVFSRHGISPRTVVLSLEG